MNAQPGELDLEIVQVGAQADGVSEEGLFVPLTLPGERVRARREGARAALTAIDRPSPERRAPPCPHFGDCGGCALQHWAAEPYLAWKREQVRLALARVRLETTVGLAFAAAPGARRRLALHARRDGRTVRLGFKARRAWRVVDIETCVIAEPALVAALPALRRLAGPLLSHPKSAPTLHVVATLSGIDIEVTGVARPGLSADAAARVAGIAAEADFARVTVAGETLYQSRLVTIQVGRAEVQPPPGAFLQASAGAEAAMGELAAEAARGARRAADLFCGVGAFALRLAEACPVMAADASAPAIAALRRAAGGVRGLKAIAAEARDLERRPIPAEALAGVDVVVFDPPRAGAAAQAAELAASRVARIVAVACNPATFARDARRLADGGYRLDRVQVVDQFLWSPHIELVALFSRT